MLNLTIIALSLANVRLRAMFILEIQAELIEKRLIEEQINERITRIR